MTGWRWTACALALALAGCGGGKKHFPIQPMAFADQGRYYIRSVTVVSNEAEADFDSGFRNALNDAANTAQASGQPVDLYLTVEDFNDASVAAEIIGGARSAATAEIALRDPDDRNRAVYRDVREVSEQALTGVATGHPIALALSLAFSVAANAATNEAESMGETLAEYVIDDLVDKGLVMLPKNAAFALPPRARDAERRRRRTDDAPLAADGPNDDAGEAESDDAFYAAAAADPIAPREPRTPVERRTVDAAPDVESVAEPDDAPAGLALGIYATEADARDEAETIAKFSGDVAPASTLEVAPAANGFALTAVGLRPSAERMLCARRRIENKPCG